MVTKNVPGYYFGSDSTARLSDIIKERLKNDDFAIFFVDIFFKGKDLINKLNLPNVEHLFYVDTVNEPTTDLVDEFVSIIREDKNILPSTVVGIGGGSSLDVAKAVSNLLTNGGKAEDYQGWDMLKKTGIYKIGVPTISGTGAESSRTCVMMNKKKKLKLGMNSKFTLFDCLILDPDLTKTVPREQYFYTGLDTYIHCIESLNGSFRHPMADSYSNEALRLSRGVFAGSDDMMSDLNREKLMVASYFGGTAIANSFVGIVHPLSAGLSVVLGLHHCIANCLVMNKMEEYYPQEHQEFQNFLLKNNIVLPQGITNGLSDELFNDLYDSTIIHEKPLTNALGKDFKKILSKEKVIEIFKQI